MMKTLGGFHVIAPDPIPKVDGPGPNDDVMLGMNMAGASASLHFSDTGSGHTVRVWVRPTDGLTYLVEFHRYGARPIIIGVAHDQVL